MISIVTKLGKFNLTEIKTFFTKKETIVFIISCLFFALYMYAAANKLADYQKFKVQLGQSPILTPVSGHVLWFIPGIEVLISVLLVVPKTRLVALYASFSLMVMFTSYIVAILNFTEKVPCACGGIFESMQWKEHFLFNIFFIILAVAAIILQTSLIKKDGK